MPLEIVQIPCLADNYGYLVHDVETGTTACIDTPDVEAINATLLERGWTLSIILNTHHHWDHAGGNIALKERWACEIIGPEAEQDKIPGLDRAVRTGDSIVLGNSSGSVFDTPGHTNGHIVYHFEKDEIAFVGDTIFALGCGRLFEGTPAQMWKSLCLIAAWPEKTSLYCAHEYTQANAQFSLTVDPKNETLQTRAREIDEARRNKIPTVPTTIALEKATSPFLRANTPALKSALQMTDASDEEVFAEIRRRKDAF